MKYVIIVIAILQFSNLNAQVNDYEDNDLYNIGLKYLDSLKNDEAISYFSKAISINPGNSIYFYKRGGAYFNKSAYELAIADFEYCFKVIPDEAEYPYLIGICYEKLNKDAMALTYYSNSINLDSEDERYFRRRANLNFKMENYLNTIKDYNELLILNPKDGASYFYRGVAYYKLNDKKNACIDWNNALLNSYSKASEYIGRICK
ncbi:MAG: tetratricopeptide repeat protein [Prolixibacteraceae bacterium]|nr:tetratricopeptide repeat protein [Prolixibacteraceae bacterium]